MKPPERFLRLRRPALAFEGEGHCRKYDDERAHFARGLGNDRASSGTGTAAQPRTDKNQTCIGQCRPNLVPRFTGRGKSEFRIAAGPETARDRTPKLNFGSRNRTCERLNIGVRRNKIGLVHPIEHHPVKHVRTGATDANDLDGDNVVFAFRQSVISIELNHKSFSCSAITSSFRHLERSEGPHNRLV